MPEFKYLIKWTSSIMQKVKEILEAKDRKAAGVTAPAHGLMLVEIRYPKKQNSEKKEAKEMYFEVVKF